MAAARGKSGLEELISDHQAFALAYAGHLQEATKMLRRASDLAQQTAHREKAAGFETRAALWEAFYGDKLTAKPAAMAAFALAKNREVQYGAVLALAIAGDSSQAQTLTNDLESGFPGIAMVQGKKRTQGRLDAAPHRGRGDQVRHQRARGFENRVRLI